MNEPRRLRGCARSAIALPIDRVGRKQLLYRPDRTIPNAFRVGTADANHSRFQHSSMNIRSVCPKFVCIFRTRLLSEKSIHLSDMAADSPDLKSAMLERIRGDSPRKVWTPSDFVDLASRDAVDKALQRLTKTEILRRIDRGLYDQPGFNKLTQKPNPPDPRSVIDAVGRRDQTRMLVDGMTAANDLGLTDAVPAKIIVHTDARRRPIKLGNVTITFRPTAASKLFWAGRPAMRVVQALYWLRDILLREGESDRVSGKLAKLFEDPAVGAAIKADLAAGITALPTWMWTFLKPLIEGERGDHDQHVSSDRTADDHDADDHHRDDDDGHRHGDPRLKRKSVSTRIASNKRSHSRQ
ncbi:hypothetical protein Agau_P200216 (plasmid) [Agrobacterium tumefaciens F2]|jgi:Family of unknown function (DUF6088)|nr:hypothetical protein Agau_P200216 [Agrobacterium tumefaciens F2]